jgi:acetyl esterase/lipase
VTGRDISPEAARVLKMAPFEKAQFEPADPTWRDRAHAAWEENLGPVREHASEVVEIGGVRCLSISTTTRPPAPTAVLFLHGGAYVMGSPELSLPIAVEVAHRTALEVISVDYRLAPEHPYPAAIEDVLSVYRALAGRSVAIVGESAGGGLAVAAAVAARDEGLGVPDGLVLLAPFADLTGTSPMVDALAAVDPWFPDPDADLYAAARAYAGTMAVEDPRVSPVFADLSGLGPMLIQVGSLEVLAGDAFRLARAARTAGIDVALDVWDGLWHIWHDLDIPEARQALDELGEFVERLIR